MAYFKIDTHIKERGEKRNRHSCPPEVRARSDHPFKNCVHLRTLQQSFKEHTYKLLKRQTFNNLLKEDIQRDTCRTDFARLVSKLLRLKQCLTQNQQKFSYNLGVTKRIWYFKWQWKRLGVCHAKNMET
jgi:hypothetical protein